MLKINDQIMLSPLNIDDAPVIFKCIENNRQLLAKYLYWVQNVVDVNSTAHYINERANSQLPNKQWFKVHFNGDVCGIFAIKSIDDNGLAELGYWLSAQVHGNGIIATIVQNIVDNNKEWNINNIEIRCLSSNLASIGIALKLGAIKEDVITNFLTIDNDQQDLEIYRMRC